MAAPMFDPTHAVRFDLPRGSVRTRGDEDRVVLIPAAALGELLRASPPHAAEAFARTLGAAIGRRAAARMGDAVNASIEAFVTQLAGEAAVAGVGAWSVERWGRALVVAIEKSGLPDATLAPLVSSALEAASGRAAGCALLASDDGTARLLLGRAESLARVRDWIAGGVGWSEAIVKLHGAKA